MAEPSYLVLEFGLSLTRVTWVLLFFSLTGFGLVAWLCGEAVAGWRGGERGIRKLCLALAVPLTVATIVGVFSGLWTAAGSGSFTTPDEAGNYLAARALAEDGHYWLELSGTGEDPEGLLHPRTFVSVDGRAVPVQFPLTPILHAGGFALTGGGNVSAGLVAAIGAMGLFLALRRVARGSDVSALLALTAAVPLLYWLMKQYSSTSSFIAVEGWALWATTRWLERPNPKWGVLAGGLHGAALLARPDYFPFALLAAIVAFFALAPPSFTRRQWFTQFALMSGSSLLVFGVYLSLYNTVLYGGPLENGQAILATSFGREVPVQFSSDGPLGIIGGVFFPIGAPDLSILTQSLLKYLIVPAPFLSVLGCAGFVTIWRRGSKFRWAVAGGLIALIVYGLISRLNSNASLAEGWSPNLIGALSRYWVPVFLLLTVLAAAGARRLFNSSQLAVVVGIAVILAVYSIGFQYVDASIKPTMEKVDAAEQQARRVKDAVDSDGLVYAGFEDKYLAAFVDTATYIGRGPEFAPLSMQIESIKRQVEAGVPVYLFLPRFELSAALQAYNGISFVRTDVLGLVRLHSCSQRPDLCPPSDATTTEEPADTASPLPAAPTKTPPPRLTELQSSTDTPQITNRWSCRLIRGTSYLSEQERQWFQANCVAAATPR